MEHLHHSKKQGWAALENVLPHAPSYNLFHLLSCSSSSCFPTPATWVSLMKLSSFHVLADSISPPLLHCSPQHHHHLTDCVCPCLIPVVFNLLSISMLACEVQTEVLLFPLLTVVFLPPPKMFIKWTNLYASHTGLQKWKGKKTIKIKWRNEQKTEKRSQIDTEY